MLSSILVFLLVQQCVWGQTFEVPDATVEVFTPRGLRVSIPDQKGIKLFAFHGKVNEEFTTIHDGGIFSKDVLKPVNGRWVFEEPFATLKVGDVLHYWLYVIYRQDTPLGPNELGYQKVDQQFKITELTPRGSATTSTTQKPEEGTCLGTVTIVNGKKSKCGKKLIFHDDFSRINKEFWTPEVRFAGEPDFEFTLYQNRPETLAVKDDGLLWIKPVSTEDLYSEGFCLKPEGLNLGSSCTGTPETLDCVQKPDAYLIIPPATSGRITTKGKFSFKYGRIEVRAKLPKGNWIYPEILLSPKNEHYGPGYASGQMRVAFLQGNDGKNTILRGGCIFGSSPAARSSGLRDARRTSSWSDDFHTYSLEWNKENITLRYDGSVYGNIYPPDGGFAVETQNWNLEGTDKWKTGSVLAPFDQEFYVTLGVGVGGYCFEDSDDDTKPWKNGDPKSQKKFYRDQRNWLRTWGDSSALQVDYVKIWSL